MFDIEEDVDLFAPQNGVTLANVFSNALLDDFQDSTLKYNPPKLNVVIQPEEEVNIDSHKDANEPSRRGECLIAKAAFVYQLINGAYSPKGTLGFAIMRLNNSETKVILYNDAKVTISTATVNQNFKITLNDSYINYYDDISTYWSVLISDCKDLTEVVKQFKELNVDLTNLPAGTEQANSKLQKNSLRSSVNEDVVKAGNDCIKKQNKATLIHRMANMGHSILPRIISSESTSDSSDGNKNNAANIKHKTRHKVQHKKPFVHNSDATTSTSDTEVIATNSKTYDTPNIVTYVDRQIIPMPPGNINDAVSYRGDFSLFLSEHRATSSELRINVNRVTDKVDQVLDKIKNFEQNSHSDPLKSVIDVYQKLLKEYEDKIKLKDKRIKELQDEVNNVKYVAQPVIRHKEFNNEHEIAELKTKLFQKENEIENMMKEILHLREQSKDFEIVKSELARKLSENISLMEKINEMSINLDMKEQEIMTFKNSNEHTNENQHNNQNSNTNKKKLKSVMNDTFHSLVENFDKEQTYSGKDIQRIIATVIKKTTLESLKSN